MQSEASICTNSDILEDLDLALSTRPSACRRSGSPSEAWASPGRWAWPPPSTPPLSSQSCRCRSSARMAGDCLRKRETLKLDLIFTYPLFDIVSMTENIKWKRYQYWLLMRICLDYLASLVPLLNAKTFRFFALTA